MRSGYIPPPPPAPPEFYTGQARRREVEQLDHEILVAKRRQELALLQANPLVVAWREGFNAACQFAKETVLHKANPKLVPEPTLPRNPYEVAA